MHKIYHAIIKELRLLRRDLLGFAIIFLMPLVLVITITFIQHSVESNFGGIELPILLADNDKGDLSRKVIENLNNNSNIKIISEIEGNEVTTSLGKEMISTGEQRILIVIPEGFSEYIQTQTDLHVAKILSEVMPEQEEIILEKQELKEVEIYFDPAVGASVRNSLKSAIENMISNMETKAIYNTFEREFDTDFSFVSEDKLIAFSEHSLSVSKENIVPNAVQHNLPAWTLFALFFIVIPFSINIVKEKNQGTYIRLKTLPVSSFHLMLSKIIVYLLVCMIQFYLMLLLSIFLFPVIGLPALDVEGKILALSVVAFFSGLAAIGLGVLIGTFANTHEQAAPFGATSVVILAAIGGLWFPVYAMPETMQKLAKISPMNWGLESFYNVLLRETDYVSLAPYLLLLLAFFLLNMIISVLYEKKVNQL